VAGITSSKSIIRGQAMITEINTLLRLFRSCFSRNAPFSWFVILIFGFLVRLDSHGVTSMVRWLCLDLSCYSTLLAFFRADSWSLSTLQQKWQEIVLLNTPAVTIDHRRIMIGDGIKIAKEAEKMPAVKKLHQESDNSGKAPYIQGHHFGVLGLVAGHLSRKLFCIPLCAELHEGVETLRRMQCKKAPVIEGQSKTSITTLMAALAVDRITALGCKTIVALDAYFAVGPVFLLLKQATDATGQRLAHLVTRAKSNVVAYEDPPPRTGLRGAPKKYGAKVKLRDLFAQSPDRFQSITIDTYRKRRFARFLIKDLIWKPAKEKIRFVLVIDGNDRFILMCSDLSLSAEEIIKTYGYRFKIEVTFKALKHLIGAFSYHFWTYAWPKIGSAAESDLSHCQTAYPRLLINQTMNAIEGFVNLACIATGILQILSLRFHDTIWSRYRGWLRTISSTIPSEETVKLVIQQEFYHNFRSFKHTAIYRIIMSKKRKSFTVKLPGET
jgi:hypothetical protein